MAPRVPPVGSLVSEGHVALHADEIGYIVNAVLVADNVEIAWEYLVASEAQKFQILCAAHGLVVFHRLHVLM